MKLIRESVARTTASIAARAAALDHEFGNYTVKAQAVVIIPLLFFSGHFVGEFLGTLRQANKIGHRLGGFLLKQSNDDVALRSFEYSVCSSGSTHAFSSPSIVHERPQGMPVPLKMRHL